jgi:hypothetical protein
MKFNIDEPILAAAGSPNLARTAIVAGSMLFSPTGSREYRA